MVNCPTCGSPLTEDFGLVNCASCGSPVLLGMDGEVSATSNAETEVDTAAVHSYEEVPTDDDSEDLDLSLEAVDVTDSPLPAEDPLGEEVPPTLESTPTEPNFDDVIAYANSEESSADEGPLRYNLHLKDIDTAKTRKDLEDTLCDSKFQLDFEELIGRIHMGELVINDLSAVKCAILVQRLRALPIQISWEQYAIQQA